jgi:small subunit ribosomal protein S17
VYSVEILVLLMLRLRAGLRFPWARTRLFATNTGNVQETGNVVQETQQAIPSLGIAPLPRPSYQTHVEPVYTLPLYGATETAVSELSESLVDRVLKSYGGLLRKRDEPGERREHLRKLTRDRLTISGVIVSDKMDKSVVIAARRRAYSQKYKKEYAVTRRFMAHDEFNLCKEGDIVTIRSCRPLSRWKSHVVVRNYGDKTRTGEDKRAKMLELAVAEEKEN